MSWIVITAAVLPALILLFLIWKRDHIKREPVWLVLLAFLAGTVAAPLSLTVSLPLSYIWAQYFQPWISSYITNIFGAFFEAAIPEELAKFAILALFLLKNRWFDEYMDGIVYGAAIGLGFAALENVVYLINSENWILLGSVRALLSVPVHFGCGIVMGYYYSLWRIERKAKLIRLMLGIPILFHGIYDCIVGYVSISESVSTISTFMLVYLMALLSKKCKFSIKKHLAVDREIMDMSAEREIPAE